MNAAYYIAVRHNKLLILLLLILLLLLLLHLLLLALQPHCVLWPVEQWPFHFFLSATNSLHLLTPST